MRNCPSIHSVQTISDTIPTENRSEIYILVKYTNLCIPIFFKPLHTLKHITDLILSNQALKWEGLFLLNIFRITSKKRKLKEKKGGDKCTEWKVKMYTKIQWSIYVIFYIVRSTRGKWQQTNNELLVLNVFLLFVSSLLEFHINLSL